MLSPPDHPARANTLIDTDAVGPILHACRYLSGPQGELPPPWRSGLKSSSSEGRAAAEQMCSRIARAVMRRAVCVMQDDIIRMLFDLVGKLYSAASSDGERMAVVATAATAGAARARSDIHCCSCFPTSRPRGEQVAEAFSIAVDMA